MKSTEPELEPTVKISHKAESSECWKGKPVYDLLEKAEVDEKPDHKQLHNYREYLVSLSVVSQWS